MSNDWNPLESGGREAFDFASGVSKALHGIEATKQTKLLEEQIRLQKEANELEKKKLAQSSSVPLAGSKDRGLSRDERRAAMVQKIAWESNPEKKEWMLEDFEVMYGQATSEERISMGLG